MVYKAVINSTIWLAIIVLPMLIAFGVWSPVFIQPGILAHQPFAWFSPGLAEASAPLFLAFATTSVAFAYSVVGVRFLYDRERDWDWLLVGCLLNTLVWFALLCLPGPDGYQHGYPVLPAVAAVVWVLAVTLGVKWILRPDLWTIRWFLEAAKSWHCLVADDPADDRVVRLKAIETEFFEGISWDTWAGRQKAAELQARCLVLGEMIKNDLIRYLKLLETRKDQLAQTEVRDNPQQPADQEEAYV